MSNKDVVVLMSCNHTRSVSLVKGTLDGDTVFCLKCWEYRSIVKAFEEWRVRCPTCHWGRSYGSSEFVARSAARKHHAKHPGHITMVIQGDRTFQTLLPQIVTEKKLGLGVDSPPF